MKPTINEVTINNNTSVIRHLAKRIVRVLTKLNQRLDEQEEEIRKLKHRVRKLENKNV